MLILFFFQINDRFESVVTTVPADLKPVYFVVRIDGALLYKCYFVKLCNSF